MNTATMTVEQALVEECMLTEAVSPNDDPRTVIKNLIQWHINVDQFMSKDHHERGGFRSRVTNVAIKERQVGERIFNSIRLDIGGLPMHCDLNDGSTGDGQIRKAKRIADDHQAFFMYDDVNSNRCRKVLGIEESA